jgi:ubiquinone biosynthesis protein Coq4
MNGLPLEVLVNISHLLEAIRVKRNFGQFGDYKGLLIAGFMPEEIESKYTPLTSRMMELLYKEVNLDKLKNLPDNTFGHHYWLFLSENQLSPFNFSEKYKGIFSKHPVLIRSARLHDMIHVLTNCNTTMLGEFAVFSFISKQNYVPSASKSFYRTSFVYYLFYLLKDRKFLKELRIAHKWAILSASKAKDLMEQPLEEMLSLNLHELRHELGIEPYASQFGSLGY